MRVAGIEDRIRYEPDEWCPTLLSIGVAFQGVIIVLANIVLFVTIAFRAANLGDDYISWGITVSLLIGGAITVLQAGRLGRLGAAHILMTGASPHFIAVSVLALALGGISMLASLVVVASLVQFAVAAWLPLLRRIITPVVSGTALMLIAVTVMSIAVGRLGDVPAGAPPAAGPAVAAVTLVVATLLAMRAAGLLRLWGPLIGIASGCAVAAIFGLYDAGRVIEASWLALPNVAAWQGLDLTPGGDFWTLLPVFLIVSLVGAIKTSSDSVVIQRVSRNNPQATDFRLVQGSVNTNGLGTLLSGFAGTLPTIAYSPTSLALINLTGVAARNVGYAVGIILLVLAFLPKVASLLLTVPTPVAGAFLLPIMGLLFVEGMRTVFQDGLDPRRVMVVAVSLSVGVGLVTQDILVDLLGRTWGAPLDNGLTAGVLVAILMTAFIELTSPRRRRLEVTLESSALPKVDDFLSELGSETGWSEDSTERLRAAGEETLSSLLRSGEELDASTVPRLIIVARPGDTIELEFMAVFDEQNLEDRLAHLSDQAEVPEEHEISFRLLRHYASSVSHRKYHGIDIVTVQVEGSN